jgi:hypothetical protein
MLASLSQAVALILGIWLIGVSLFMVFAPRRALEALSAMGGSGLVHFVELGLRTAAGFALVLAASSSKTPALIGAIGWFLAASALVIMVAPRRWHATYSNYWARRIPIVAVRLLAPVSALAGGALIWTMT